MEQIEIILKVQVSMYKKTDSRINNHHLGIYEKEDELLLPSNKLVYYGNNVVVNNDSVYIHYTLYDSETKLKKLKKDNCFIFNNYVCLIKQMNIHSIDEVEL